MKLKCFGGVCPNEVSLVQLMDTSSTFKVNNLNLELTVQCAIRNCLLC